MSSGPIALAGHRLLLSFRNRSCCAASGCIDLLVRQPLSRRTTTTSSNARAGSSMSRDVRPSCPPMTAIVVSKKNLPSFSEKRATPPLTDALAVSMQARKTGENPGGVPSSTAVESALRSALGIGHSETVGPSPAATVPQPVQPLPEAKEGGNVSSQDPAILDWSLCNPALDETVADTKPETKTTSTRILHLLHGDGGAKEGSSEADGAENSAADIASSSPLKTTEGDPVPKTVVAEADSAEPSSMVGTQVGDDAGRAATGAASTPAKRSRLSCPRKRLPKLSAAVVQRERSLSNDGSSSDESCLAVVGEPAGESEVAAGSGWISELPGLLPSADTDNDDDDDPVYSLKPLFAGKFGSPSSSKKSKSTKSATCTRPNCFVGIQVDNINVHRTAKRVQDHMRIQEPNIEPALLPIATSHVTVLVFRVNDGDDSLQRAKDALSRGYEAIKDDLEATPLVLHFEGLDLFENEILYAKVVGEDSLSRLKAIRHACREEFKKADLDLTRGQAFRPHLTLAKISRKMRRKNPTIKKIKEEWYTEFKDEPFGSQQVKSLQLLCMTKPKDERGYYYCSLEHMFGDFSSKDENNDDHSECCAPASSKSAPGKIEQKLLKLDDAKREVKRKISTLTNAKLQEISKAKEEFPEEENSSEDSDEEASK
ncbi:uncharacterized protein LOC142557526 [Dermacentor variabilis]|uniref:uncharacterized protein LOC142557526 n=1 Tax=Dermacentor variabilis TaxID=34621 RepID=UPI003F5C9A38